MMKSKYEKQELPPVNLQTITTICNRQEDNESIQKVCNKHLLHAPSL